MPFDWKEYLILSKYLKEQINIIDKQTKSESYIVPNTEALCRCIISRSYYASYCHAYKYAIDRLGFILGQGRTKGEDHFRIRDYFNNQSTQSMQVIGINLTLRGSWRIQCDYYSEMEFTGLYQKQDVKCLIDTAIQAAEQIFNLLV
jgi:hypothetical protein